MHSIQAAGVMASENMRNKAKSIGNAPEKSLEMANFCLVILLRPNKHFSSYKSPKADDIDKVAVTSEYVNICLPLLLTLFDGWWSGSFTTLRKGPYF